MAAYNPNTLPPEWSEPVKGSMLEALASRATPLEDGRGLRAGDLVLSRDGCVYAVAADMMIMEAGVMPPVRPEWAARAEAWIPQAFTAAEIMSTVRWHLHREADMPDTGTARTRAASWVQMEIERDPSGRALRAALLYERPRRRAEIDALFAPGGT